MLCPAQLQEESQRAETQSQESARPSNTGCENAPISGRAGMLQKVTEKQPP